MFDAFGNPLDDTDNLVAAGSQWTAGGNSVAARRARVKLQRRDRYGRWAEMGGGISFWGRKADGSVVRMIGRYIGPAQREGYMRVYIAKDGDGYKAGVYEVPGTVATAAKAIISLEDLEEAGVDFDINGNRIGQVLDRDIEPIATMFKGAPNSLDKQLANDEPLTETEKATQEKARLKATPHVSYNVVDENGNLIEQPAAPASPQAPANQNVNPLSDAIDNAGDTPTGFGFRRPDLDTYILSGDRGDAASAGIEATVTRLPSGEYNSSVSNNGNVASETFDTPLEAVNHAHAKITEARNNNIAGRPATPAEAPMPAGIVENRSEGMTLYQATNGDINPIQVVAIGGGKAWQVTRNKPGQNPEVLSTHSTREDGENEAKARIAQEAEEPQAVATPPAPTVTPPSTPSTPAPAGPQRLAYADIPGDILSEIIAQRLEDGVFYQKPNGDFHRHSVVRNPDGTFSVRIAEQEVKRFVGGAEAEIAAIELNAGDIAFARGIAPQRSNPLTQRSQSVMPSGTAQNIQQWIDSQLASNADLIDESRLTDDSLDPFTGATRLGGKNILANLKNYRAQLITGLKESALDGKQDDFAFKFAVAKRVTAVINAMHQNQVDGNPAEKGLEFNISAKQVNDRLGTFQIVPNSVKTEIGTQGIANGKTILSSFDALLVAKDGKPYLFKWNNGSVEAYQINPDGSLGQRAGGLSASDAQRRGFGNGENYPTNMQVPGMAGSISTSQQFQALGLASGFTLLNRWVATRIGARYSHSGNLMPNGNFYSKTLSPDMRDNDRTQADKAVHQNNPNGTIFKVMKALRWIDGEYKPLDLANQRDYGSGWLKRLTINNSGGAPDNKSKLDKFTYGLAAELRNVKRHYGQLSDAEKARTLPLIPEIFRDHITGEDDWSKWDVQYNLLSTVYADGKTKDEVVQMMNDIKAGRTELDRLFPRVKGNNLDETKFDDLLNKIIATDFRPEDNNYTKPQEMRADAVRMMDIPFAGHANFSRWTVPTGVRQVENFLPFNPRRAQPNNPAGWTEEPVNLAQKFSAEQLLSALRESLVSNQGRSASLPFGDRGDEQGDVNPDAIFKALEQQGQDAHQMLAEIYDEIIGDPANPNQTALNAARSDLGNLNSAISALRAEIGELDEPTAFDNIGGRFIPDDAILHADVVKRQEENVGGNPALDLQPLSSNNANYRFEDGGIAISGTPYSPQIPNRRFYIDGTADNPKLIARNFSPAGLENALTNAIGNKKRTVKLQFANGSQVDVPLEAIRDALQYQGVDINSVLASRDDLRVPPRRHSAVKVVESQDGESYDIWEEHNNGARLVSGQELGHGSRKRNSANEITQYNYDVERVNDPTDPATATKVAKLVKVVRNADGKYEVWVSKLSDQYMGDFSERPADGVYDSFEAANFDISTHIKRQHNLENTPGILNNRRAIDPGQNAAFTEIGVLNDDNPEADFDGITIRNPRNGQGGERRVYGVIDTRIPDAVRSTGGGKYIMVDTSDTVEQVASIGRDADGVEVAYPIYTVVPDGTTGKFILRTYGMNGVPRNTRIFNSKDEASLWGKHFAVNSGSVSRVPTFESAQTYAEAIRAIPVQYNAPTISEDNSSKTATAEFVGKGGELLQLVTNVKKGAHPTWRNAGSPDNAWVHATVSLRRQGASGTEESFITAKITRRNSRSWIVNVSSDGNADGSAIFGRAGQTRYFDTKTEAHEYLFGPNGIKKILGLGEDDKVAPDVQILDPAQQRRNAAQAAAEAERLRIIEIRRVAAERVEAERLAAEMAAAQNAGDVDTLIPGSMMTDEEFNAFLAERGAVENLLNATNLGPITQMGGGRGVNDSLVYQLPDGRKFKVKPGSEEKGRNESAMHALYRLFGIQVTEGRLGLVQRGNDQKILLADAFQENIIPRNSRWTNIFDSEFNNPEYAQAIADMHEGLMIDALVEQWDLQVNENSGNAFIVRDANGILRGVRCDPGSGGLYNAAGNSRIGSNAHFNRNALDFMVRDRNALFGDFMATGRINGENQPGHINRGLTVDALKAIARRTILPLNDRRIDALVDSIIVDPIDNAAMKAGLKRRRLEILEYMGIDPNESAPQGTSARLPERAPGLTPPNLADNGYEYGATLPNGKRQVRFAGRVRPDGVFIPNDWSAIPPRVKSELKAGDIVPEYLPFMTKDVPAAGIPRDAQGNLLESLPDFIDANGIQRHSPFGVVSLMVRKRKADGTYEYLFVQPGSADPTAKAHYANKLAPLHYGKNSVDEADPTPQQMMLDHLGNSVDPISTRSFEIDIPGSVGKHKVIVADIGDQDLDISTAQRNGKVGTSYWRRGARLQEAQRSYWNQFDGQTATVVGKLNDLEQNWTASPSNEPAGDTDVPEAGNGGGPINPPTPPNDGEGNAGVPTPSDSGRDADGYRAFRQFGMRDADGNVVITGVQQIEVGDYRDGSLKAKTTSGTTLGTIKPIGNGNWVATYMPDEITGRDGANRNGNALKGIFTSKEDADSWLSKQIHDRFNAGGPRKPISGNGEYNPNAASLVEIKKGFLNETTTAQTDYANRLIEQKRATPQQRALFRAILSQEKPTTGEVGYIINQLRDAEDRDPAEIADSRAIREAGNSAPINSSSLDNVGAVAGARAIRADRLRVGQRILGKVNANVVFTAPGDNNTINVGVVGDDGALRVYRVGNNSVIAIGNETVEPDNRVIPPHPEVVRRREQARLVLDRVKAQYPNHRELPNGDLIVGQREHRQANGEVFRYEAIVHKMNSDEFVSYVRKQKLDAHGNPTGQAVSAYFTEPAHSPKVTLGRLGREVLPVVNAQNPANGFNQRGDRSSEILDPATGQMLPSIFVPDQNIQYIGDTGIQKTGNAAKDALISYVQNLVARGVAQPDIINQVLGGNQNIFTRNQLDDIIDRLEANRSYPGVNAIPYVSKDDRTIVRVGDRVKHYDAFGQPIEDRNGNHREGTVVRRQPYVLNAKRQGNYEYSDQLFVQWDLDDRPHQAAARRLEVIRRGDGSAPVPAVQGPNDGGNNNPPIDPMPLPGQQPVAPAPANDADNNAIALTNAVNARAQVRDFLDNQGGQLVNFPGGRFLAFTHPDVPENGGRVADIQVLENGQFRVSNWLRDPNNPNNVFAQETYDTREEALVAADKIFRDFAVQRNAGQPPARETDRTNFPPASPTDPGNSNPTLIRADEIPQAQNPAGPVPNPAPANSDANNTLINLPRGNDRRGEAPGGVRNLGDAQFVQSFWDDDFPANRYNVVRTPEGTKFVAANEENLGAEAFIKVERTPNGGFRAIDPRALNDADKILYDGDDRRVAEAIAINSMNGNEALNAEILRQKGEEDAGRNPNATPPATPNETDSVVSKTIGGKEIIRRGRPNGEQLFIYEMNEVGRVEVAPNGKFLAIDVFNGDQNEYDNLADAIADVEGKIETYAQGGLLDTPDDGNDSGGGNGGTPPAPSTPPAGPLDGLPVAEDTPANVNGVVVRNGEQKFNVSADGEPEELREIGQPNPNSRLVTGNGEPYFENEDGTVWPANWTTMIDNLPPVAPFVAPEPQAPQAPQAVPAQAPRLPRPRVNPVQPGERFVRYHAGRDGNYWDIIDRKSRRKIGRADTIEKANEMAAGLRGLDGKLIDYDTPVAPRQPRQVDAKFPRPSGYRRTAVGQGYFLENTNDPNGPVARVEYDADSSTWVGNLYANKADAEARRAPIGEFSAKSQNDAESKANGAVQEELDRRNPPAPAPAAPAPVAQPAVSNHQRTDLGPDMFSLHDGNKEYGIAEKGTDGKWTARIHENPRDALSNRNPIATGSFDTPEEAEAAMRQAIADRQAPQAANILQWQSGSDGKSYLGLDGVPGIDANNAPVYGISPGPFGGWIVAGWSSKADKDAGLPPVAVTNHANEQDAKDSAMGYAQQAIDSMAPQQPATPPAPAPAAPPAPAPAPRPAPRRRQQQQWQGETPPWLA